ncbi:MAG: S-methyl-5-thioribose kinase [Spirochaetes bacterium]|nr:MAG: S-methyl-5-thioribose kinase [Spirochaetota bacterium]
MAYFALDNDSVLEYVRSRDALDSVINRNGKLNADEIGDGNLNQVFIVRGSNQAIIVKQALTYLKVAGESWPLTRERMRFETQALLKHNELAPGLAPEVYDHDEEMSVVVMEFLGKHEVMRKPLVERRRFPDFPEHISTFLARTLFLTSDLFLSGVEKKEMQKSFINPQLCEIQEDFVYTNPYMESEENKWNPLIDAEVQEVRSNSELKLAIVEMKTAYMMHAEAMIHSDLHTGSIMLNEKDTRVIDPEFSFFGPMAYDVAALLQNLVLNYLSHFAHTPDPQKRSDYQHYLLGMIRDIWNLFAEKFDVLWVENNKGDLVPDAYWAYPGGAEAFADFRKNYLQNMLQDVAGHGGTKFLRRMMGIVTVWDISSIEDEVKRADIERMAIRIGKRWLLERKSVTGIDDLIDIVTDEAPYKG